MSRIASSHLTTTSATGPASSRAILVRTRSTRLLRRGVPKSRRAQISSQDGVETTTRVALEPTAHTGAVLALAVIPPDPATDRPLLVMSTSMDGTAATWRIHEDGTIDANDEDGAIVLVERLEPSDGSTPWWCVDTADDGSTVYVGTHARDARALRFDGRRIVQPPRRRRRRDDPLNGAGRIENHTGWVRALARLNEGDTLWGFSTACNYVRVWRDVGDGVLVDANELNIFTGDILALRATSSGKNRLFAGVADGTVRGWDVQPAGDANKPPTISPLHPDDLTPASSHPGRVASLVTVGGDEFLVSGCHGGVMRSWDVADLTPRGRVVDAHGPNGSKVRCIVNARGGDAVDCYSGGDDGWVRAWAVDAGSGEIGEVADRSFRAVDEGSGGVRAIADLRGGSLVVGDDRGVLSAWRAA